MGLIVEQKGAVMRSVMLHLLLYNKFDCIPMLFHERNIYYGSRGTRGAQQKIRVIEGDDLQNTNKNGIKKIINSWINERVTQ